MRQEDASSDPPACLYRFSEDSARRTARLVAACCDALANPLCPAERPPAASMSRDTPRSPELGRVPMVIEAVTLAQLRRVAARSECSVGEMLVAVFGLVLDGVGAWGDTAITVLPSAARPDLPAAEGAGREADESAMPAEMRAALSRTQTPVVRDAVDGPAIAFRHVRRWVGEEPMAGTLPRRSPLVRFDYGLFDLVLEVNEFDNRLLLECFFRPAGATSSTVGRLLHAYVRELYVLASSLGGEA